MGTIEVFADIACPFAYVGIRAVTAHRREVGATDTWLRVRAWPLEAVNGEAHDGRHLEAEVDALRRNVAPHLFAGFDPGSFPRTTLPALRAAAAAYRADTAAGDTFSLAVRDALWDEGRDVSDPAVLDELLDGVGVGRVEDADGDAVAADLSEGRARGVIGSPHWFTAGGDFFCPSLDITKERGQVDVRFDQAAYDGFIAAAFG
jgi:predicted DsbA family dithiol-disulfide isomerase